MRIEGASARIVMRKTIWSVTATSAGFSAFAKDIESFGRVWAKSGPAAANSPRNAIAIRVEEKKTFKFFLFSTDIDNGEVCFILCKNKITKVF
jgi:hypothetical protein